MPQRLDGNAAAGRLADVFTFEITAARTTCAGCGATSALAGYHVYADAPGMVIRCPSCEAVVIRIVQTPQRTWLDARGAAALVVETA